MQKARELSNCDAVLCIMSGNFVQRAEPAIADKYTRASWAINHGADIVIELPTVFAVSTADNFARGAVKMLSQIKNVTHLSFGCEADEPNDISKVADILARKDFAPYFRKHIDKGVSYATAVSLAMTEYDSKLAKILDTPNNMLGLHYISAIKEYKADIIPVPIKRVGCDHNDTVLSGCEFSSATAIRNAISNFNVNPVIASVAKQSSVRTTSNSGLLRYARNDELYTSAPKGIIDTLLNPAHPFPDQSKYDAIATHALRTISIDKASLLQSVSEGLHHKLLKNASKHNTVQEIITATKSKRYTYSRISRIILEAVLGITKEIVTNSLATPPYYRVLAVSEKKLFGAIPKPLIVKNSDFNNLTHPALQIDKTACGLYTNLTGCNYGALLRTKNIQPKSNG